MKRILSDGLTFGICPAVLGLSFGYACWNHDIHDAWLFGSLFCFLVIGTGFLTAFAGHLLHKLRDEFAEGAAQ